MQLFNQLQLKRKLWHFQATSSNISTPFDVFGGSNPLPRMNGKCLTYFSITFIIITDCLCRKINSKVQQSHLVPLPILPLKIQKEKGFKKSQKLCRRIPPEIVATKK